MEKYSLGSIKRDSIRRVFSCIKKSELISRLEISKEIGLSLMTVGKIADALADKNIIIQQKGTTGSVGRKASYISLNKDNFALVLDFSDKTPSFAIVNIAGEVLYSESFEYDTVRGGEIITKSFFDRAKTYTDMNYLLDPCMGVGVIVDDGYTESVGKVCVNGEKVSLEKYFLPVFKKDPTVTLTSVRAKAAAEIAGERSALYFELCAKSASGAYSLDGEMCDINGTVLGNVTDTVTAITAFLAPRKVVLDSEGALCDDIKQKIAKKCKKTEVLTVDASSAEKANAKYIGCAALVCDEYINITKRL